MTAVEATPHDDRRETHDTGRSSAASARRWLILLGVTVWLLFLTIEVSTTLLVTPGIWGVDFKQYWDGAARVAAGFHPYEWLERDTRYYYPYPPLLAVLLVPLTWVVDYPTAVWLWLGFSVLCIALSCWLVARTVGLPLRGPRPLTLMWAAALLPAVTWTLAIGQISPQLLLIATATYAALAARRDAAVGALVALAASIKVFPAVLGGYLLLRGNWRALVVGAATGLALLAFTVLVVGWEPHWIYVTGVVPSQPPIFGLPFNVGITGFFTRVFIPGTATTPILAAPSLGRAIIGLSTVALLAASAYAVWRARPDRDAQAAAYSLAVVASLLISPINGQYNLIIALLPLAVVAARVQAAWPRHLGWFVAIVVLLSLPVELYDLWPVRAYYVTYYPDVAFGDWPWRQDWGNLIISGPFFGLVGLWALLLRLALERRPAAQ